MKQLIEQLKETPTNSPNFPPLIRQITANFNDFKDSKAGQGNHLEFPEIPVTNDRRAPQMNQANTSNVLSADDAFYGYTYVRPTKVILLLIRLYLIVVILFTMVDRKQHARH